MQIEQVKVIFGSYGNVLVYIFLWQWLLVAIAFGGDIILNYEPVCHDDRDVEVQFADDGECVGGGQNRRVCKVHMHTATP